MLYLICSLLDNVNNFLT